MDAATLYEILMNGGVIKTKFKPKPPDVITKYELFFADGSKQPIQASTIASLCAKYKVEKRFVGFSVWGELYEYRAVAS